MLRSGETFRCQNVRNPRAQQDPKSEAGTALHHDLHSIDLAKDGGIHSGV